MFHSMFCPLLLGITAVLTEIAYSKVINIGRFFKESLRSDQWRIQGETSPPPPPTPLIFRPNWGLKSRKKIFLETAPPLSQGLDDLPPPTSLIWRSGSATTFHLTLHCIRAIHKSPKSLAIVTGKGKADNRVDGTVCVSHKHGDIMRYRKLTKIQSLCWYYIQH